MFRNAIRNSTVQRQRKNTTHRISIEMSWEKSEFYFNPGPWERSVAAVTALESILSRMHRPLLHFLIQAVRAPDERASSVPLAMTFQSVVDLSQRASCRRAHFSPSCGSTTERCRHAGFHNDPRGSSDFNEYIDTFIHITHTHTYCIYLSIHLSHVL